MALVSGFRQIEKDSPKVHEGQTACGYLIFEANGQPYVQLESYVAGHDQDYSRPKQLLQFDEARAAELLEVLRRAFPHLF